jgi:PncC family amidohydrolase
MHDVVMHGLVTVAEEVARRLVARKQTIAVAESSTGGLISAALLAVPGASAYYRGGGVIYTPRARAALVNITKEEMEGLRASTEPYALLLARHGRDLLGATWCLSETGATGPSGNRYGDPPGHSCTALVGPLEASRTLETGSTDRTGNMRAFARTALELLIETLERA